MRKFLILTSHDKKQYRASLMDDDKRYGKELDCELQGKMSDLVATFRLTTYYLYDNKTIIEYKTSDKIAIRYFLRWIENNFHKSGSNGDGIDMEEVFANLYHPPIKILNLYEFKHILDHNISPNYEDDVECVVNVRYQEAPRFFKNCEQELYDKWFNKFLEVSLKEMVDYVILPNCPFMGQRLEKAFAKHGIGDMKYFNDLLIYEVYEDDWFKTRVFKLIYDD